MKILIFSGTTEGRKLSEMLAEAGIGHIVSVASQYGCDVMTDDPLVRVMIGRMDEAEMGDLLIREGFGPGDIIVDATHPYAAAVSDNVRGAAQRAGCTLYRISRRSDKTAADDFYGLIESHGSMEDFAKAINESSGNILLTTGSNTLGIYCEGVTPETLARTYVRVLPAKDSLDICHDCGIETSHIIAMQGPFSYGMNRAIFAQFDIKHMLTKDSGAAGGFAEKLNAALDFGVTVHVLSRPHNTESADCSDSDSFSEEDIYSVYEKITGHAYVPKRKIVLAGIGPGSEECMTIEASDRIRHADAVFGAASVTANIKVSKKYDMYRAKDIIDVLENNKELADIAVLFSGDSSFYSGAKEAYKVFRKWDENAEVTILPGISSVSYLAAKTGESYDDAAIVSIHGNDSEDAMRKLVDMVIRNRKTFALTSSSADISRAAHMLKEKGADVKFYIGRDLSGNSESIEILTTEEAMAYDKAGKITVLFINERIDQ